MMDALASPAAATSGLYQPQSQMDSVCGGCKLSIESETGGVVVSFGDALWHVKCFRCAKCHERVTADTNLLLLSDGSPVCGSCSYNCNVCKLPILDEAIMTGDESYHANCFTCRSCTRQIQELVFAKTSNGIYCMACHNERVARSRRHAEQRKTKAKKEKEKLEREKERRDREKASIPATPSRPVGLSPIPNTPSVMDSPNPSLDTPLMRSPGLPHSTPNSAQISNASAGFPAAAKRMSTQSIRGVFDASAPSLVANSSSGSVSTLQSMSTSSTLNQHLHTHGDAGINDALHSLGLRPATPLVPDHVNTLPLPTLEDTTDEDGQRKRKSYDDGVRPLTHFLNMGTSASTNLLSGGGSGLDVPAKPTSRANKRRSINPGLFLTDMSFPITESPPAVSPPNGAVFEGQANGRLSPHSASPLRSGFSDGQILTAPPRSPTGSAYFSPSASPGPETLGHSRSPSPAPTPQTAPLLNIPTTPPSLTFISPTPGPTPTSNQTAPNGFYPPARGGSLPQGSTNSIAPSSQSRLTPDEPRRGARSPSPSLMRNRSPSPSGRASPAPLINGGYVHVPRQDSLSRSPTPSMERTRGKNSMDSGREVEADNLDFLSEFSRPSLDSAKGDLPPLPPPKDATRAIVDDTESIGGDDGWDEDQNDGVLVPHAQTLSAPALPPMRFSLNGNDFAEFLSSVGETKPTAKDSQKTNGGSAPPTSGSIDYLLPDSPAINIDFSALLDDPALVIPSKTVDVRDPIRATSPTVSTPTSAFTVTHNSGSPPRVSVNTASDSEATTVSVGTDDTAATSVTSPPSANLSISSLASLSGAVPLNGHNRAATAPVKTRQNSGNLSSVSTDRSKEPQRDQRQRVDSSASLPVFQPATSPTTSTSLPLLRNQAASASSTSLASLPRPSFTRSESTNSSTTIDLVARRMKEALSDATERGAVAVKLDREFVEAIVQALNSTRERSADLRGEIDTMKRASHQYMTGFTVAQTEYHKEVAARRDAEAEVTRLRVQLSGQAARLTAMSAEDRRRDMMEQMSKDLSENLHGLERDVSKLKVERDMTLAEVEELSGNKDSSPVVAEGGSTMARSLTVRFDGIKSQYKKDLEPLKQQRESLIREINELKEARDIFLEETTALNARNEELAELNSQIARQIESAMGDASMLPDPPSSSEATARHHGKGGLPMLFGKNKASSNNSSNVPSNSPSLSSVNTSMTLLEERDEFGRLGKGAHKTDLVEPVPAAKQKFKWFGVAGGSKTEKEKTKKLKAHNFQQQNVLRFARCDHCGDKMWGTQLKCTGCSIACHPRCLHQIQSGCQPNHHSREEPVLDITPLPPSMFGRDLIDQVRSDAKNSPDRMIPVIVEKCIKAVESLAMDYEGIYRKTGGSSQSKAITQLFERGNYDAFDLTDLDSFNDISSVTSVLKTYFRSLPNPLLTFALHESFIAAAGLREPREKHTALLAVVGNLPKEHYETVRFLMLHLHRVQAHSQENLMNARNLGVVFGPTLMRSSDSSKEFADMAGKALSIEWLVENAPEIFGEPQSQ